MLEQAGRLRLRLVQQADVGDRYIGWLNDPIVNRFLETRFTIQTADGVRDFVCKMIDSPADWLFAMERLDGLAARHIGNLRLGPIRREHASASVSLFIGDRASWGQGFGTLAISMVRDFAFDRLELERLSAGAYAQNAGSIQAFLAAGFQIEGRRRGHVRAEQGLRMDVVEMGMLSTDPRP